MKILIKIIPIFFIFMFFTITKANDTVVVKTKKSEGTGLEYQMINCIGYGYWSRVPYDYQNNFSGLNITTIHGLVSKDDSFFKNSFRGIGLTVWNFDKEPFYTLFLNVRLPKYLYFDLGYSKLKGTGAFTYFSGFFFRTEISNNTNIIIDLAYGGIIKQMLLARVGISF